MNAVIVVFLWLAAGAITTRALIACEDEIEVDPEAFWQYILGLIFWPITITIIVDDVKKEIRRWTKKSSRQ